MMNGTLLRKIMKNINVLNVLLLAVVTALAAYLLPPLLDVNVSYTLPAQKKVAQQKEETPAVAQPPSAMEYTVIGEQNVFHPERKIPAEKKDEKPLPKPEFVLYGTLIASDASLAFMEDRKAPYTTSGRGKRQRTLRLGGTFSGYTLSQIYEDRVIMARGEDKIEVRVVDLSKTRAVTDATPGPSPAVGTPATAPRQPSVRTPATAPRQPSAPVPRSPRRARPAPSDD